MNIKGVFGNLFPLDVVKTDLRKTKDTADREPQQGGDGGSQNNQHKLTDQELEEVIQILKDNAGVKSNSLQLRADRTNGVLVLYVEDSAGKVVRRIPENELWMILRNRQKSGRGTLINKAM